MAAQTPELFDVVIKYNKFSKIANCDMMLFL
jgi:hypothetical protein